MSDIRAAQMREAHQAALAAEALAAQHRARRDQLAKQLRREDKRYWTYKRLGEAMGSSSELATHIVKN